MANLKSISHRCRPILVAFVWVLTKETIHLPRGCLQGGSPARASAVSGAGAGAHLCFFFFFFTLVAGPRRSLSLELSDTRVYEPQIPVQGSAASRSRNVTSVLAMSSCPAVDGLPPPASACTLQHSQGSNDVPAGHGLIRCPPEIRRREGGDTWKGFTSAGFLPWSCTCGLVSS